MKDCNEYFSNWCNIIQEILFLFSSPQFIMRQILLFTLCFCLSTPVFAAEDNAPAPASGPAKELWSYLQPNGPLADNETLDLKDLDKLYQTRGYRPVWSIKSEQGRRTLRAFMDYMSQLIYYNGLTSQDGVINNFIRLSEDQNKIDHTTFDLALTDWVLDIAHELNGDAIDYSQKFTGWDFKPNDRDIATELGKVFYHGKIYEFLPTLTPTTTEYLLLARTLLLYRTIALKQAWEPITKGRILRLGDSSPRVKQVRKRLEAEAYMLPLCQTDKESYRLDRELRKIIISYQSRNGLETDGDIGSDTVHAMNKPVEERIDQIRSNMAFVRAMPRKFPDRLAYINIADASIKIFRNHEAIHYAQTIVGLPMRKTPFINSAIHRLIINPMWKIPISIARYDILPKLRKNPNLLEEKGYAIRWRDEDPFGHEIDWTKMRPRQFKYQLRQRPGPKNALGEIKFDFKNMFSVYLHGTSHKELFDKARRHKSSGCIRLKNPPRIASVILEENKDPWTYEEIQNEIGGRDLLEVEVDNPLPIFVVYRSAFSPSDDISIHFRPDMYRYDRRLIRLMKDMGKDYNSLFQQKKYTAQP